MENVILYKIDLSLLNQIQCYIISNGRTSYINEKQSFMVPCQWSDLIIKKVLYLKGVLSSILLREQFTK